MAWNQAWASVMVLALVACDGAQTSTAALVPADQLQPTASGQYRISLRPEQDSFRVGPMHSWIVHLELPDGSFFSPTQLKVGGGMPQHSHGFVTEPRVGRVLSDGDFLIEGVRFHMSGEWTFEFLVVGPAGPDRATLRVNVGP